MISKSYIRSPVGVQQLSNKRLRTSMDGQKIVSCALCRRISAYWLVSRRMHGRLPKNAETPRALHPLDPGLGDDVSITRNLFRDAAAHRVRTLTDHVEPECAQFFAEFRPLQAVHQNGG